MKSTPDVWLFVVAVMAVAVVLFLPITTLDPSVPVLQNLKSVTIFPVLAWFLAAAGFWGFKARLWPGGARECRRVSNGLFLVVLQAIVVRSTFELSSAYGPFPWVWLPHAAWIWVPWFLIPGLAGILLGGRFGVLMCLTGVLMLYLLADPGPWPLMGCMSSALVGILLLRRSPTRVRVLRAGTGTGCALGLVAAVHYGLLSATVDTIAAGVLVPALIGFFSAFSVLALLPVLEWMLGELSDVTLTEYGNDHRLLDQLRTEAPGTWHHSLNVADLAEKAAGEIGARALFCKTAALYHDVGKLKEPALFAENNDGPSLHAQLEPQISAQKIIEHVTHGIELARKYRLPKAFREIISEHHGVSIVRFFYAKACQPLPDGTQPSVDRALFCYPGPAPSTRESGIIALADAVEAASRSLPASSEHDLRVFVRGLFADRISEGELAKCPLTLSDLAKIEAAFVSWLKGRNHHRPAYPATATDTIGGHLASDDDKASLPQPA
jgi:putative nucleotidyltransferase with HDIG domain